MRIRDWDVWLRDRIAHREPVDAHFRDAFDWLRSKPPAVFSPILELGPGPEMDLTNALRGEGREVWTVDIGKGATGPQDKVIEQGDPLPFDDGMFGVVLAREVFEHVLYLPAMLENCLRVLKPGGRLWFSTPFTFPLHDVPGDYWRISEDGWRFLLEGAGFREIETRGERFLFDSWQMPVSILGWAQKVPNGA